MVAIIILTVVLIEMLGIVDKFIFKYIIDKGTEFSSGLISKEILISLFIGMAVIYFGTILAMRIVHWFEMHLMGKLETNVQYDLKKHYFGYIVSLDHNFHTTNKTGALISRLGRAASASERFDETFIWSKGSVIP